MMIQVGDRLPKPILVARHNLRLRRTHCGQRNFTDNPGRQQIFGRVLLVASSRTGRVCGRGPDATVDCARKRIEHGLGQIAVVVADWTMLRPVGRTLRTVFQPLREHCAGNCVDDSPDAVRSINWTPTWTLRVRQMNCFADSSGNCPDVSRLLRQLLCGHSPVLREMLPGNCSDTARKLPGHCSCDSPDVAQMLRGHSVDTDWPRTGHGLDAATDIVPAIRQHRLGRYPSIARMLAE